MSFLPEDYTLPTSDSGYMKFADGENKIRIMESPIVGYELWIEGKPKRYKKEESIPVEDYEKSDKDKVTGEPRLPRHFWAMVVWNYADERMQILEVTQRTIQKAITALSRDKDWGSPKGKDGYDIVINREGKMFDTEYQIDPKPKTKLDKEIVEAYEKSNIKIDELFTGGNPFAKNEVSDNKDLEDATKALTE